MKILFITPDYPVETGLGGIATYVFSMARALKKVNGNMDITVLSISFKEEQSYEEDGINVIRLKVGAKIPLGAHWKISAWIIRNYRRFDVIEEESFMGYSFFARLFLGKKYRYIARLHGTFHEVYVLERKKSLVDRVKKAIGNHLEKNIVSNANLIIANSPLMGVYSFMLWNIDFERMHVLQYAFDFDWAAKIGSGMDVEELSGKEYVLFFGRIQKKKGSRVLEKIIRSVLEKYPNLHFVIVGYDNEGIIERWKDESRVIHFGHIYDKKKLYAIIKRSKAVILPSHFESFLYTAVEAVSLEVPTIVSRTCGVVDYLGQAPNNDLIINDINNEEEYMVALERVISDYTVVKEKCAAQAKHLRQAMNMSSVAEKYLALIKKYYQNNG